jgi:hypothetical protein
MGLFRILYRNKSFILLCFSIYFLFWLIFGAFKQPQEVNKPTSKQFSRLNSTFSYILSHLLNFKLNLLLIDPDVLNYLFIDQSSFDKLDKRLITFGITDQSIEKYFSYLEEKQFSIKISKNISLDHVFIEYKQNIIHLAILHPYHSYYLIQENTLTLSDDIQLYYGDVLRAVEQ